MPSMIMAVIAVATLAFWDEVRESSAALDDFAQEQATLAASVANDLRARLVPSPSPQADLLAGIGRIEKPNALALLVQAPGDTALSTTDGRHLRSTSIEAALADGLCTVRLTHPEAAALGLPERIAVAGLAHVDAGARGRWGVAVVASAWHERDRELRARWRLVLAVLIAGGLTFAFGGFALRHQRMELQLAHELELNELARQRDERLERLSQAATMLTLASGMAHELSTPLGVIAGRAEQLIPKVQGDERATRGVQAILEQAERIREVMRGFLGLARGGAPTLQDIALANVVRGASALVEHRFAKAGVTLSAHVPESLPPVRGEPRLLEHALVNLLLNACDASPRDSAVEVRARALSGTVEVEVFDRGVGIASQDAARVTEPFFTTKPTGTGLGLAITNEIVKTHRGAFTIGPAQPAGTRAAFRIPIAGEDPHD
jgi:two-component system NtrC family sensor kinase